VETGAGHCRTPEPDDVGIVDTEVVASMGRQWHLVSLGRRMRRRSQGGHGGSQLRRRDGDLWWLAMVKNLGAYGGGQPSACERGLGGGRCPDRHARAGEGGGYRCTTEGSG
jgi:hypothetical protein